MHPAYFLVHPSALHPRVNVLTAAVFAAEPVIVETGAPLRYTTAAGVAPEVMVRAMWYQVVGVMAETFQAAGAAAGSATLVGPATPAEAKRSMLIE